MLFIAFVLGVFTFSLMTTLLLGVLAAFVSTALTTGVALVFAVPTFLVTTFGAILLFLWGLGAFQIIKWLDKGDGPAKPGEAIGDKLDKLTGGQLKFVRSPGQDNAANGSSNGSANDDAKRTDGHGNGKPTVSVGHTTGQPSGHIDMAAKETGVDCVS